MQLNSQRLVARFLRYVRISSQSSFTAGAFLSSSGQMELAKILKSEATALGLSDIKLTDQAILTARLKGSCPNAPAVGYTTHLDTFDAGLSPEVKPQILRFEGEDIILNLEKNITLKIAEHCHEPFDLARFTTWFGKVSILCLKIIHLKTTVLTLLQTEKSPLESLYAKAY